MNVENLEIADLDGCEADGWALPLVRVRVVAKRKISAISFEFWFPEEDGNNANAMFVISSPGSRTQFLELPAATPKEVVIPTIVEAGNDASIMLTCDHLIANKGADIRELSFIIMSIKGVAF